MKYSRYAVYFTFQPGPLATFGAAWLGWDLTTGRFRDAPLVANLPAPVHVLTETPRKYGLHGTIKPPFRLSTDQTFENLHGAFVQFCKTHAAVRLEALELSRLGRFLALTAVGDTSALDELAAHTVIALDRFRAPPTDADLERRRRSRLTQRQDELLRLYGYPHVLDQFRFHITLTGKLAPSDAQATLQALRPHLDPLLPRPFVMDALTLCGEDEAGQFHEIARCDLTG